MSPIHALGIDIGSTTAKIVAVDDNGQMIWYLMPRGFQISAKAQKCPYKLPTSYTTPATVLDSISTFLGFGLCGYTKAYPKKVFFYPLFLL